MKALIGLIIACLAFMAATQRASYELETLPFSAFFLFENQMMPFATKKDLLVYGDVGPTMVIRRRNTEGTYVSVANYTGFTSSFMSTNGKWIVFFGEGYESNVCITIDENNKVSTSSDVYSDGGYILSDDTFVGYVPTDQQSGVIQTFEYYATNNSWIPIPGTGLAVSTPVFFLSDYATYRASDTHLVIMDVSDTDNLFAEIYERQVDLSWKLVDNVTLNMTYGAGNINFNGVDTLVHSLPETTAGAVYIYTKINGEWNEQLFTLDSVGYRPLGYFGVVTTFLDNDTLLLSAGREGYDANAVPVQKKGGKVLMMTRNSTGLWEPVLDLIGPDFFGLCIGANDEDLLVSSVIPPDNIATNADVKFSAAPRCFYQPINVTCHDHVVNNCTDPSTVKVSVTELYTINNPQCGSVSVNVTGTSLTSNTFVAQFRFTRGYGANVYCNVAVTCVPPESPVSTPTGGQKASGANTLQALALVCTVLSLISFV